MPPYPVLTAWAAQFIVSRERIVANPKHKYEALRKILEPGDDHWLIRTPEAAFSWDDAVFDSKAPWAGHALERSWPIIFNCSDAALDAACGEFGADPNLCQCFDHIAR